MDATLEPPADADDWLGLGRAPLPVAEASAWAVRDDCGGVVTFTGTARDHSEGRPGVHLLEYEAYEAQVVPRLARVAAEARSRWATLGRLALLHRIGPLDVGEAAVVVVASAPHRDEAFAAARFCIDTLKATVPIWKKEAWDGGSSWGLEAQHLTDPSAVAAEHAAVAGDQGTGALMGTALVVLAIIAVVGVVLVLRGRPESSIESGITSFRREMRALAPPRQAPQPDADSAPPSGRVERRPAASPPSAPREPGPPGPTLPRRGRPDQPGRGPGPR